MDSGLKVIFEKIRVEPILDFAANYKTVIWYEDADVTTELTSASLVEINRKIVHFQNDPQ